MEEFIDSLQLPFEGLLLNNKYIIDLSNSNDFSTLFDCIASNDKLTCDDKPITNDTNLMYVYSDGYYEIVLKADFEKDLYNMEISER